MLNLSTVWRDILPYRGEMNGFNYAASSSIIELARPSLKNSIEYSFNHDSRRPSTFTPNLGSLFQIKNEFAGFGGDVNFFKTQLSMQHFLPAFPNMLNDFTHNVSFNTGILFPFDRMSHFTHSKNGRKSISSYKMSSISDRFWLGGPMILRGFNYKGIGPRSLPTINSSKNGDSLGGDITWSLGYALSFPFPYQKVSSTGIRCHTYCNAGNLSTWGTPLKTLVTDLRASAGLGVIFPLPFGRFEVSYSHVLLSKSHDHRRSFQIGLGVEFL